MKTCSARIISTYASDTSGVCSALYELGGMTVVHDASGCNSTYSTHDEPRWYNLDSMIYISALTEADAVSGNDAKLVGDVVETARELSPKFIALCGAPIPMMIGTDFEAIAAEIGAATRIPTFAVATSGMHSYLVGAKGALEKIAAFFVRRGTGRSPDRTVNVLGATPLDFSLGGNVEAIHDFLRGHGFRVLADWAMTSSLAEIAQSGAAHVNLVVSYAGLGAARFLEREFGIPWVAGVPVGAQNAVQLADALTLAAESGRSHAWCAASRSPRTPAEPVWAAVGESVWAGSLARALELEAHRPCRVLCPLETEPGLLLAPGDVEIDDEDAATVAFAGASGVIADPLYAPVSPPGMPFVRLPHEAFSGRCFHRERRRLIDCKMEWDQWLC